MVSSRRQEKASQAIKEVVSTTVLFTLRDPRIKNVTVLAAEASADLQTAKVYVSVMGEPKDEALTLHGLESAKGFIQSKIAERLQTRYTPVLTFVIDRGVKKSVETARVMREQGILGVGEGLPEGIAEEDLDDGIDEDVLDEEADVLDEDGSADGDGLDEEE